MGSNAGFLFEEDATIQHHEPSFLCGRCYGRSRITALRGIRIIKLLLYREVGTAINKSEKVMFSLSSVVRKIIHSNDNRITRLHDRKGHLLPIGRLLVNGPKALWSYIFLQATGKRPRLPWISYSAINVIAKALSNENAAVLEFGSGMSTLWFCDHASHVCSVEHDPAWFAIVDKELKSGKGVSADVKYRLATERYEYSQHANTADGIKYDLMLVDGPWRADCLTNNMHLVKLGGIIYLDNSDADSSSGEAGEIDRAVEILLSFAKYNGAEIQIYSDFSPTCLFASQGILVRLPKA